MRRVTFLPVLLPKILVTAALLSSLSACLGIRSDYPTSWSPIEASTSQCPSIQGSYKTNGPASDLAPKSADYLRYRLGLGFQTIAPPRKLSEVDIVSISQPDGESLVVEGKAGKEVLGRKILSQKGGDWHCEDGKLLLREQTNKHAELMGSYYNTRNLALYRATDGSLIGEMVGSGTAVFLVVPILSGERFWFMWPKVPE